LAAAGAAGTDVGSVWADVVTATVRFRDAGFSLAGLRRAAALDVAFDATFFDALFFVFTQLVGFALFVFR